MKNLRLLVAVIACLFASGVYAKTHLFILSGQSNMTGFNPAVSFSPTVKKLLVPDEVIVVKSAQGGQPIRRWYKAWEPAKGDQLKADGLLYDKLNSFAGLVNQLSDCLNKKPSNSHWMDVREAQIALVEENPHGAWVDTDDLNGPKDDLHYNKQGYAALGKCFAEKAVAFVKKTK